MAPSNPCSRVRASAWALGSNEPLPKNSSDEMPFWFPNFFLAKLSSSAAAALVNPKYYPMTDAKRETYP